MGELLRARRPVVLAKTSSIDEIVPDLAQGDSPFTARARVLQALLDLQSVVPLSAALITVRRLPSDQDRPVFVYRMAAGHVQEGLRSFIPRSREFALVLERPREVLDWTRVPTFVETAIAREHLLTAGYTQGISFVFLHGPDRVVGTFHLNVSHTSVFSDRELQAVDRARTSLEQEVGAFVVAGDVGLSRRELEVLRLVATGASNTQVAAELHLSLSTVKTHVEHVLAKLRVSNRILAVREAALLGLL